MEGIRRALVLDLVFIAGTAIEQTTSVGPHNYRIVVSTHSIDPYLWGESNNPAFGPRASLSLHLPSSSSTPAGSVHKSRGDSVVVCGCS